MKVGQKRQQSGSHIFRIRLKWKLQNYGSDPWENGRYCPFLEIYGMHGISYGPWNISDHMMKWWPHHVLMTIWRWQWTLIVSYVLEGDIQQKGKTKASVLLIAKCAQNIFSVGHFSGQRMQTTIQVFVKIILKCKSDMESLVSLVYSGVWSWKDDALFIIDSATNFFFFLNFCT